MSTPTNSHSVENSSIDDIKHLNRPSANFQVSPWQSYFLRFNSSDDSDQTTLTQQTDNTMEEEEEEEKRVRVLKDEIKNLLLAMASSSMADNLNLIDSIQRLGLSYHFETEIHEILEKIFYNSDDFVPDDHDLHTVSLRFRLLRQHGYNVPFDVLRKFMDENGNEWKESIKEDVRGMLSLYEASHLRVHGDHNKLDEAIKFTTFHLQKQSKKIIPSSSSSLAEEVKYSLKWPIHLGYQRHDVANYIEIYQKNPSHLVTLLNFAKLDFNILQKLYQRELCEVTRWFEDSEIEKKLPFARSRTVECYLWALGYFHEPKYTLARKNLTKVISMTSVMDDIYDLYGTFEELELLTDAINRWDKENAESLPNLIKVYFEILLRLYEEIEKDIIEEEGEEKLFYIYYAKEAMKRQAKSYFEEAKWLKKKYTPTKEEYLKISIVSTCYYLFTPFSFMPMGDLATKDTFEWVDSYPKLLEAIGFMGRVMNDIVSRKFEKKRKHIPSAVDCYMKEDGLSEKEAIDELEKQIVDAWKTLNEYCMRPTQLPWPLCIRVSNLARTTYFFYKDGEDLYTCPQGQMEDYIKKILVQPVL